MEISELLEKQRACYLSGKTRSVPYRMAALRRLYDAVRAQTPQRDSQESTLRTSTLVMPWAARNFASPDMSR